MPEQLIQTCKAQAVGTEVQCPSSWYRGAKPEQLVQRCKARAVGTEAEECKARVVGTEAEECKARVAGTEAEECKARVVGTKAEECKARVGTEARNTPLPPDCPFVPRLECLVHYWNGHPRRIFSPT